jgi:DNA-binding NtrC family response regulator
VDDADVVFNGFGLDTAEHREIISAIRERYPETPVIVETAGSVDAQHAGVLRGCFQLDAPLTSHQLREAIGSALEASSDQPQATP